MNKKVYLVEELYSGASPHLIGVCSTIGLAKLLKQRSDNRWDLEDSEITMQKFSEMICTVKQIPNSSKSILERLIETYPEYSITDIEKVYEEYKNSPYITTLVSEVDFFDTNDDVLNYEFNN